MASASDILSLSQGVIPAALVSANTTPTQAIIVGNQQVATGIPCVVGASVSQAIDLMQIGSCTTNEVRFNFANGASFDVALIINAAWRPGYASVFPKLGFDPSAIDTASFTTDGVPSAGTLQAMQIVGTGGYTINGFSINTSLLTSQGGVTVPNAANTLLSNADITVWALPFDPHDNAVETTVYNPYCDCCTFNNNNGVSTKCFDLYVPCTWRSGLEMDIPAGATGSFTLNIDMVGIANTDMNPAAVGMPA